MRTVDAQIALENVFYTAWADETPIAFNNMQYDSTGVEEWVRFDVNFVKVSQMSMGADCGFQRQNGFVNIQIFTKLKEGSQRTLELIDMITDILSGVRVDVINVFPPTVNILGETAQWYVSDMDFDFAYEFVRP